jgi:Tfp pilus assembly protein PilF
MSSSSVTVRHLTPADVLLLRKLNALFGDAFAEPETYGAEPPSDLWSLGVTLFVAVEGTSPFKRETVESSMFAVLTAPVPEPRKAGPLAPLIKGLLERDPQRRLSPDGALALLAQRGTAPATSPESGDRSFGLAAHTPGVPGQGPRPRRSRPTAGASRSAQPDPPGDAAEMIRRARGFEQWRQMEQAEELYRKAAAAGATEAMRSLARLSEQRGQRSEAERWSRRAAEAGDARAMNNLGAFLEEEGRLRESEDWYRRAAEAGVAVAMNNLGVLLEGRGEEAQAEEWYRRAAEDGNPYAMRNLGRIFDRRGSVQEAQWWYRRAAQGGA